MNMPRYNPRGSYNSPYLRKFFRQRYRFYVNKFGKTKGKRVYWNWRDRWYSKLPKRSD